MAFEDDKARERARKRLLTAAKTYGIVPIGFMTNQLRAERLSAAIEARTADARKLPTGVLTFLLTDIEDSTGLLRRLGDRYAALLEDVRTIIRTAVERESGWEVDARADEFFAVFERPDPAARAAIEIQRSLRRHAWPDGERVPVRIGLHTGEPKLTRTGYVGLDVHIAARVGGAGHGGQIVVSEAACQAVAASAPDRRCRSLGFHRLPRLPQPMELFQLDAGDLPTEFPPPRTTRVSFAHVAPTAEAHDDLPGWG